MYKSIFNSFKLITPRKKLFHYLLTLLFNSINSVRVAVQKETHVLHCRLKVSLEGSSYLCALKTVYKVIVKMWFGFFSSWGNKMDISRFKIPDTLFPIIVWKAYRNHQRYLVYINITAIFPPPPSPVAILLSSSQKPSDGLPSCSTGGPLKKSFQSPIWADSKGRTPGPVHPVELPWCLRWRSCQPRSDRKARAPGRFLPPRTPSAPRKSTDGGRWSAPSNQLEPTDPTGQWQSRPLEWSEVMTQQLWREEIHQRHIFINKWKKKLPWKQSSQWLSKGVAPNHLRERQACKISQHSILILQWATQARTEKQASRHLPSTPVTLRISVT